MPLDMKIPPKMTRNPAYDAWIRGNARALRSAMGDCDEDYYPEDYDKVIPDDGAWIMILITVNVGRQTHDGKSESITVPRLSIWYALPNKSEQGRYQAIIQTPQGAVHIWVHEYKLCDIGKFLEFSSEDGFNTHFLSASGAFDEAALFYLRSRGIPKGEAQRMLLATLKDPNYCYFTFSEDLASNFSEGTGTPYLHAHNHARRKANHERRIRGGI
jgi:hypothetical protein